MTILIGLTGGIATGKSTFTSELHKHDVPVIDCDLIAREVVEPGTPAYRKIVEYFGREAVVNPDGTLNRKALGAIVFADEKKRRVLTGITGPAIFRRIVGEFLRRWVWGRDPIVVVDAPTLFESKFLVRFCRKIVVIATSEEVQLRRLAKRDGSSEEEARMRMRAQMPIGEKVARADYVIWNDEDGIPEFRSRCRAFIERLRREEGRSFLERAVCTGPGFLITGMVCLGMARESLRWLMG